MGVNVKVKLGELQIGEQLGVGGFGVVHRARLAHIDADFAVKLLEPHPFNKDAEAATKRFLREAEILLRLRHEYIVPIYWFGEHEGKPFILMEHFKGLSLHQVRQQGIEFTPAAILPFIERVAVGLGHAHAKGIVHRDIKPPNLMTLRAEPRILDFGIAALLDPNGERFTKVGATPVGDAFSAPELLENPRLIDARSDLYSLGACWLWLLTGRTPAGHNWQSLLRRTVEVPQDYENVLFRCLEQADDRYQTAEALVKDLRALQLKEPPSGTQDGLDDMEAAVLGAVFELCDTPSDGISVYQLEQRLGRKLSKVRLAVILRRLNRLELLGGSPESNFNGEEWIAYSPTDRGAEWVEQSLGRIESLLEGFSEDQNRETNPIVDDYPF